MREWIVAGAVVESSSGVLLVRNRRRNGSHDWSPPGGVIEIDDGESVLDGLHREVLEETGLRVAAWGELLYEVEAEAPGLGWVMRAQIWRATSVEGDLEINDPDGIVVEADYVDLASCPDRLRDSHDWVREPLTDWLEGRWATSRAYRYRLEGETPGTATVIRL